MIESVKLIRFKQFRETEVELPPFGILMGGNNAGKTTVLQADLACTAQSASGKAACDRPQDPADEGEQYGILYI